MTSRPASRARPRRWAAFIAVGVIGFIVQLVALSWLTGVGLPYLLATALAVELAIVHNFLWHERWTWRDRPAAGRVVRLRRLLRFNGASGVVSLIGNIVVTMAAVELGGASLLVANTIAVVAVSAINFALGDRWVFAAPATRAAVRSRAAVDLDGSYAETGSSSSAARSTC